MFILYAIPIGLVAGLLLGGRPSGLSTMHFRWGWVAIGGLLVQLVLFLPSVAERVGDLGVPLYLASTGLVLAAIVANARMTGMPLVALGAASNLAAIVANGGYMPASAEAYAEQGRQASEAYSNTRVLADPALAPLTDVIRLPAWLPGTNVISIGDVLIGLGIVVVIVVAMRRARPAGAPAA